MKIPTIATSTYIFHPRARFPVSVPLYALSLRDFSDVKLPIPGIFVTHYVYHMSDDYEIKRLKYGIQTAFCGSKVIRECEAPQAADEELQTILERDEPAAEKIRLFLATEKEHCDLRAARISSLIQKVSRTHGCFFD
jgi:hypothetical protein